jgi:hypothetical protein
MAGSSHGILLTTHLGQPIARNALLIASFYLKTPNLAYNNAHSDQDQ